MWFHGDSLADGDEMSAEAACERLLLGRLGSELALIYHDTLQAPVPAGLQALIDRLEQAGPSARPGE